MQREILKLNKSSLINQNSEDTIELKDQDTKMQGSTNKNKKVYLVAIAFSLIVGFSFIGVKASIEVATPLEILIHRFNFAFLASLIPVGLGKVKIHLKDKNKKILIVTACFYVGFMILQTIGLIFATSVEAGILFAIIPILAKIIAAIYLKEKSSPRQNIFVYLSVASVIAMFVCAVTDISVNIIGIVILFLASLSMAISNVLMRGVRESYSPIEIAFGIAFMGFLVFNITYLVYAMGTGTISRYFLPLTNLHFIIAIAYLGVLSTLVSSLLMSYMLSHMEAIKATIFGNLSTAISIVAGVVLMKEPLAWYHILCTALIIVGVIGVSLTPKQESKL